MVIGRQVQDGEVIEAGTTYYPHTGERVWVLPVGSLQAYFAFRQFQDLSLAEGGDAAQRMASLEQKLAELCMELSGVVVAWDWTDNRRKPLAQPYENPAALRGLEVEEMLWLADAAMGETTGERKNGMAPSGATSSATGRRRKR